MEHQVNPARKFRPRTMPRQPHPVPPPQPVPLIEENVAARASWIPAKSELHFIAGGSVSKLLRENTCRAKRVFPAGWAECVEDWSLRRSMS